MNRLRLSYLSILSILTLAVSPWCAYAGTVYFDNTDANWNTVYAHYWGGDTGSSWTDASSDDPTSVTAHGVAMTRMGNSNLWKVDIDDKSTSLVFNNNADEQTVDIVVDSSEASNAKYRATAKNTKGKWTYNSDPYPLVADSQFKLYLFGDLNSSQDGAIVKDDYVAIEMTRQVDGTFTASGVQLTRKKHDDYAYVSFCSTTSMVMHSIVASSLADTNTGNSNADRYGSSTTDETVTYGSPSTVIARLKWSNRTSAGYHDWALDAGKYNIKVDLTDGMEVTFTPANSVNMPLTKADFVNSDGTPRAHYFLVGSRQGDWHLQPEWELEQQSNGTWTIPGGRFIYPGYIGIAKVDNYYDYTFQRYKLFAKPGEKIQDKSDNAWSAITLSADGLSSQGTVHGYIDYPDLSDTYGDNTWFPSSDGAVKFSTANAMILYANMTDEYQDPKNQVAQGINTARNSKGLWCDNIVVTLDSDSNPAGISFSGLSKFNAKEFIFTLVGGEIHNERIDALSQANPGVYDHPLWDTQSSNGYGWHDAWVQYDDQGNVYHDGNGELIYQTVFTRSWFKAHPSYFYRSKDNLLYTSDDITFVNAAALDDLDNDPFKNFYTSRPANGDQIGDLEAFTWSDDTYTYTFPEKMVDSSEDQIKSRSTDKGWECFVVKDIWVSGDYKIWSGWGGNSVFYEFDNTWGSELRSSQRWNRENGGSAIKNNNQWTGGFDVNSSAEVEVYPTYIDVESANFYFGFDMDANRWVETFFDRIIFWYNAEDGIENGVLQFISQANGPKIRAYEVEGDNHSIEYRWYIDQSNVEEGTLNDKEIASYTITRYRVTSEGESLNGVTEENIVPEESKNIISKFDPETGLLTFIDKGTVTDEDAEGDLPAGTYLYVVSVTYSDGVTKSAKSNRITIYDPDNVADPDPLAFQLIELTKNQEVTIDGTTYTDAIEYLAPTNASTIRSRGAAALNYRTDNGTMYIVSAGKDDSSIQLHALDATKTWNLIKNHPEAYTWTSDFYVRSLTETTFNNRMNNYRQNGLIQQAANPVPELTVTDSSVSQAAASTLSKVIQQGDDAANPSGKGYYGSIVKRSGSLAKASFNVAMSYTVDNQARNSSATTMGASVMPKPYSIAMTGYEETKENIDGFSGELTASVRAGVNNHSDPTERTLTFKAEDVDLLHLNAKFTLRQPNVSPEILAKYDIRYQVNGYNYTVINGNKSTERLFSTQYVDRGHTALSDGYSITVSDVNPHGDDNVDVSYTPDVYPGIEVTTTTYIDKDNSTSTLAGTYHYTDLLAATPNVVTRGEAPQIGSVQLEYTVNGDLANCNVWGLRSYSQFSHMGTHTDVFDGGDSPMTPSLYMLEATDTDGGNYEAYYLLSTMQSNATVTMDTPRWFATQMPSTVTNPTLYFTPVYIFAYNPTVSCSGLTPATSISGKADATSVSFIGVTGTPGTGTSANPVYTGVEEITIDSLTGYVLYNLQGQRVLNPVRGQVYLAVLNGHHAAKKVIFQ
ncbi:MAG: starch-binding protein [Bacteroidales bacterium]|nr:starch-binding protein [Bacteroidales bacterium]